MEKIFVTFCARHARPWSHTGILGVYDLQARGWEFTKIRKRGFIGACISDGIWLVGYKKIFCYDNLREKPVRVLKSKHFSGLHSIQKRGDDLYIVSAGNNCVYKWDLVTNKMKVVLECANHPNTICGNYVTVLNKEGHSKVYDLRTAEYTTSPRWWMSHNYNKFDDGYVILNGNGTIVRNDDYITSFEGRFLRGMLVNGNTAYIGLNVFLDVNNTKYIPPQIAHLDLVTGEKLDIIDIPNMKEPWVIYDILEAA